MCGICGFVGHINDRETVLAAMMNEMKHRGPDDSGAYFTSDAALGFQRLSIIDLHGGVQPMKSEDSHLKIVFNGEIYNYQELRQELQTKGISFCTNSDTEVLINGLQVYGLKLMDMLRGMFAFGVWNENTKCLMLARDFFGIKPLYYAKIGECFVFASEIKCILKFPGYQKQLNEAALEQYLSFQYSVLDETFFKGIYRLPPGSILQYQNGKALIKSYFSPKLTPSAALSPHTLERKLEHSLHHSLKRHMVSDVEVGAFLSGGVDSAYLASCSGAKRAFTVGFLNEDSPYSEIARAKEIAAAAGLEHHTKIISKDEFWDAIGSVMYHMDEPTGDASAIALYFLVQEASQYVKVVLSGEGSDELFGGYNIYKEPDSLKWLSWIPFSIRRGISALATHLPDIKGRDYLIRAGKKVENRYIGNACIFNEEEKKQLLQHTLKGVSSHELLKESYKKVVGLKDAEKMQSIDLKYWLPGDILQKADKMSMAGSLEVRVPFLDKDVYDVAMRVPLRQKITKHTTKYLFRKIVSKDLAPDTSQRKKLGFPVPIRLWLRENDWYEKVYVLFTSQTAGAYFHKEKLLELLDAHNSGKEDNSRKIWTILAFLMWHKKFME